LSTANEITCRELVEIITDYLEGTMPQAERRRFEAHLEGCPYCVTYLGQMRQTIRALGELLRARSWRFTCVGRKRPRA
jgi:anti-sigma factor RsiW